MAQDRLMLFNIQMVPNPSGIKMWGRKEAGRAGTEKVEVGLEEKKNRNKEQSNCKVRFYC